MKAKRIVVMLGMAVALSGCESGSLPKYYHSMNNPNIGVSNPGWLVQRTGQGYELTAWGRQLVAEVDPAAYESWSDAMFSYLKTCKRGLEEQQASLSVQGQQDYGMVCAKLSQVPTTPVPQAGKSYGTPIMDDAELVHQAPGGGYELQPWLRMCAQSLTARQVADTSTYYPARGAMIHALCALQKHAEALTPQGVKDFDLLKDRLRYVEFG